MEVIQCLLGLVPGLVQKVDVGNVKASILSRHLLFLKNHPVKYSDSSNLSGEF